MGRQERLGGQRYSARSFDRRVAEYAQFVAFGPVEDPEVVVMVIVYRPDHAAGARGDERFSGSRATGPAAGHMLERALELRGLLQPRANLDSTSSADTLPIQGPR